MSRSDEAGVSRRTFVTTAAAAGAGLVIVPREVLGRGYQAPSDTLNIAVVGIGGMGGVNCRAVMSQNIVAICDVDGGLVERRLASYRTALNPPPPTTPLPDQCADERRLAAPRWPGDADHVRASPGAEELREQVANRRVAVLDPGQQTGERPATARRERPEIGVHG